MTKKIRRTLSLLLTLTLIFSQLPQSAFAVSAEGSEPIEEVMPEPEETVPEETDPCRGFLQSSFPY